MALSGLQNERMPDRWDNIGGKISTETQNKTALTEGTSIKTERKWPHGWTKHVIWSYISYPPTYWTTYLLDHLYLTTNKTINCGSTGTAAPNPDSVQTVMCRLREIWLYETHTVGDISWVLMSLPCISTALNAVGLGILIDLLQKKTLTLTLTNNVKPFNNVKPLNDHSTVSLHFCFIPIQT